MFMIVLLTNTQRLPNLAAAWRRPLLSPLLIPGPQCFQAPQGPDSMALPAHKEGPMNESKVKPESSLDHEPQSASEINRRSFLARAAPRPPATFAPPPLT